MTYLDLLNKIKDGTHSKYVMFNGDLYKWTGKNYTLNYNNDKHLADMLHETDMVSKNCIWEVIVMKDEDEPETKTLGDIIAEKCF